MSSIKFHTHLAPGTTEEEEEEGLSWEPLNFFTKHHGEGVGVGGDNDVAVTST